MAKLIKPLGQGFLKGGESPQGGDFSKLVGENL